MQFLEAVTPPVLFPVEIVSLHKWCMPPEFPTHSRALRKHAQSNDSNETLVYLKFGGHFADPRTAPIQKATLLAPFDHAFRDESDAFVMEVSAEIARGKIFLLPQVRAMNHTRVADQPKSVQHPVFPSGRPPQY